MAVVALGVAPPVAEEVAEVAEEVLPLTGLRLLPGQLPLVVLPVLPIPPTLPPLLLVSILRNSRMFAH